MSGATQIIPVAAYAVAAYAAAPLLSETAADVFDDDKYSRARYVAAVALKRLYPLACYALIAQNLRLLCTPRDAASAIRNARAQGWYDPAIEEKVVAALLCGAGLPDGEALAIPELKRAPKERICRSGESAPAKHHPLVRRAVTAALLGDPPLGRREMLAALTDTYSGPRERWI